MNGHLGNRPIQESNDHKPTLIVSLLNTIGVQNISIYKYECHLKHNKRIVGIVR